LIGKNEVKVRERDATEALMSFPVFIHQDKGHFVATLVGSSDVHASAPTREEALAEIQSILQERVLHGDLVFIEAAPRGIVALAGKYRDDPTLSQIREDIYLARDAEPLE
jgi:hypothetical protein